MKVWTVEAAGLCLACSSDLCCDLYGYLWYDLCCDLCCDPCYALLDFRLIRWNSDHFPWWSDGSGETFLTGPPPQGRSGSSAPWENQPGDRPESPAPGPPRYQLQHTVIRNINILPHTGYQGTVLLQPFTKSDKLY